MKIFIENDQKIKSTNNQSNEHISQKRIIEFDKILNSEIISIEELEKMSWNGIPQIHRSKVWKILLKYTSTNKDNHEQSLNAKRKDYFHLVNTYIDNPKIESDLQEKKITKLIHDDVIRTIPGSSLFRDNIIQHMLERYQSQLLRILFIWHVRHPSSGYVQGLNDIVTPFIIVFISDFMQIDMKNIEACSELKELKPDDLKNIEADCYWCFSKVLNGILHNYTNSWPGIKKSFDHIKLIIQRVDPAFLAYFEAKDINFYHIYFKWVTCLLLRQFSFQTSLRLFDTFISLESIQGEFFTFVQYIFVAIFLKYSKHLKNLNFEELMSFENKMPTKTWNEDDIGTIIAEAFVYQSCFSTK